GPNRTASIGVTLSKSSSQPITVHYATVNGTATAPADFVAKSGTLTFKPGTTTLNVTVPIKPNTKADPNKTFQVVLSAATGGSALSPTRSSGTVTILNDDVAAGMRVGIGDVSICEGNVGTGTVVHMLVSLSAPATSTMTVHAAVTGGTATAGS